MFFGEEEEREGREGVIRVDSVGASVGVAGVFAVIFFLIIKDVPARVERGCFLFFFVYSVYCSYCSFLCMKAILYFRDFCLKVQGRGVVGQGEKRYIGVIHVAHCSVP